MPSNMARHVLREARVTAREQLPAARTVALRVGVLAAFAVFAVDPVAAQSAGELQPLVDFLNNLAELLMVIGAALGVVGFAAAGLMYIVPGEPWTRRAKETAKATGIGLVILLSSNIMVAWIAANLPGTVS